MGLFVFTVLRTGEVLALRAGDLMCAQHERQVLIFLGLTKGGKRQAAAGSFHSCKPARGPPCKALETLSPDNNSIGKNTSCLEEIV